MLKRKQHEQYPSVTTVEINAETEAILSFFLPASSSSEQVGHL